MNYRQRGGVLVPGPVPLPEVPVPFGSDPFFLLFFCFFEEFEFVLSLLPFIVPPDPVVEPVLPLPVCPECDPV